MNISEVVFYENYLTLDFHTNTVISSLFAFSFIRQLCVQRDMCHAGSLESTQEARVALTQLSCSPNFPRASYLDEGTLTREPVVN